MHTRNSLSPMRETLWTQTIPKSNLSNSLIVFNPNVKWSASKTLNVLETVYSIAFEKKKDVLFVCFQGNHHWWNPPLRSLLFLNRMPWLGQWLVIDKRCGLKWELLCHFYKKMLKNHYSQKWARFKGTNTKQDVLASFFPKMSNQVHCSVFLLKWKD